MEPKPATTTHTKERAIYNIIPASTPNITGMWAKLGAKLGATVTSRAGRAVGEAGGKAAGKAGGNGNFKVGQHFGNSFNSGKNPIMLRMFGESETITTITTTT